MYIKISDDPVIPIAAAFAMGGYLAIIFLYLKGVHDRGASKVSSYAS